MSPTTDIQEFVNYVGGKPTVQARFEAVCAGWQGEKSSFIPAIGRAYLYPEYFVFLSAHERKAGTGSHVFSLFWDEMQPYLTMSRWINHPGSLMIDLLKSMGKEETDEEASFLLGAINSPDSFAVRTADITEAEPVRAWRGASIVLRSERRMFTIQQNYVAEVPDPVRYLAGCITGRKPLKKISIKNAPQFYWSFLTGRWNPELAQALVEICLSNNRAAVRV